MRAFLTGLLISAALAAPARAEVIQADESGMVIHLAEQVPASPLDVWKALIVPSQWWDGAHTVSGDAKNLWIDSQATGCFCEKLPLAKDVPEGQRAGSVEHMRILYAEPGKTLRMSGAMGPLQAEALTAVLTISLKPADGGTLIAWDYVLGGYMRGKSAEMAPMVDQVLGEQIKRLAAKLTPDEPEAPAVDPDVDPDVAGKADKPKP